MKKLFVVLSFIFVAICSHALGQAPTPPEGWTSTKEKLNQTLTPPGLAKNEVYKIYVSDTEPSKGSLDDFNEVLWKSLVGTRKFERKPIASVAVQGWQVRHAMGVVATDKVALILDVSTCERDGKRMAIVVITSSQELYNKFGDDTVKVFTNTLHDRGGDTPIDPGKTTPAEPDPGQTTAQTPVKVDNSPFASDSGRVARLSEIARALQDPKADPEPLVTEAVTLCGFTVWDPTRKVVGAPSLPSIGLGLYQSEIHDYAAMFRKGHHMNLANLGVAYDKLLGPYGVKGSAESIRIWVHEGIYSPNPTTRSVTNFLVSLSMRHGKPTTFLDTNEELDPVQSMFILHIVAEDVAGPVRALGKKIHANLLVSLDPIQAPEEGLSGATEDGVVGGITYIHDQLTGFVEQLEKDTGGGDLAGGYGRAKTAANVTLAITKFITTYLGLTCDVSMSTGTPPLIRNKDTSAGQNRTLKAHIWIDSTVIQNFLKQNRLLIALLGIDVDSPKTGPVDNVETKWDIESPGMFVENDQVQTVGAKNISKIKTDSNGDAFLELQGRQREKAISEKGAMPVMKSVEIKVTPQAKTDEIQQDITDAITGMLGLKGEGGTLNKVGLVTPVLEFLYRCKWACSGSYLLSVRDWVEGDFVAHLTVDADAEGHTFGRETQIKASVKRHLDATELVMDRSENKASEGLPQNVIDMMVANAKTDAQKAEVRNAIEQQQHMLNDLAGKIVFSLRKEGHVEDSISDHYFRQSSVEECGGPDRSRSESNTTGNDSYDLAYGDRHNFKIEVSIDEKAQVAWVKFDTNITSSTKTTTTMNGKTTTETTAQKFTPVIAGLAFNNSSEVLMKGFKMPLKVTKLPNGAVDQYYASDMVPFTFGNSYKGNLRITLAVSIKPKAKGSN